MTSTSLYENHKKDLILLHEQPAQVLLDFCKLSWDFLLNGSNVRLHNSAAQKLKTDAKLVQSAVEALAHLFVEVNKKKYNEQAFREFVLLLGFSEESFNILFNEFSANKMLLNKVVMLSGIQHVEYRDLDWRFETQVSTRSLKNQLKPMVMLKLSLRKNTNVENICLVSDIPNIIHTSQVLNQALQESRLQSSKSYHNVI